MAKAGHEIIPECAATQATLVAQMETITENLMKVSETVMGNGKLGLKDITAQNSRDIAALTDAIAEIVKERKEEKEARVLDAKEKKGDTRKWLLSQASTLVTSLLAVAQTVVIAWALTK